MGQTKLERVQKEEYVVILFNSVSEKWCVRKVKMWRTRMYEYTLVEGHRSQCCWRYSKSFQKLTTVERWRTFGFQRHQLDHFTICCQWVDQTCCYHNFKNLILYPYLVIISVPPSLIRGAWRSRVIDLLNGGSPGSCREWLDWGFRTWRKWLHYSTDHWYQNREPGFDKLTSSPLNNIDIKVGAVGAQMPPGNIFKTRVGCCHPKSRSEICGRSHKQYLWLRQLLRYFKEWALDVHHRRNWRLYVIKSVLENMIKLEKISLSSVQ